MNTLAATITTAQRRALRAQAHALDPVVSISQKGLTETVLKEIDRSLTAHQLIKIRVYAAEREQREALLAELCGVLGAAPVQHIGHLLVVWRENPAVVEAAAPAKPVSHRARPKLTKKAAAAKTDKVARSRKITLGKPRRPTRT